MTDSGPPRAGQRMLRRAIRSLLRRLTSIVWVRRTGTLVLRRVPTLEARLLDLLEDGDQPNLALTDLDPAARRVFELIEAKYAKTDSHARRP